MVDDLTFYQSSSYFFFCNDTVLVSISVNVGKVVFLADELYFVSVRCYSAHK